MAQEIKKAESATQPGARALDPFTAMRSEMDRLFDSFLGRQGERWPAVFGDGGRMAPTVDISENDKEIMIEAEMPGIAEKDISLTIRDGVLSLKGEKKSERDEKKDDYHLRERSYGQFQRSFRLPDAVDVDAVQAKFENGVLHVTLPKKPEAVKSERKVPIGNG